MNSSVCNKCGRKLRDTDPTGSQDIEINFGYSSTLFDGEKWLFTLCDDCLDELARSFKYLPEGFMEDPYEAYGKALIEELHSVD